MSFEDRDRKTMIRLLACMYIHKLLQNSKTKLISVVESSSDIQNRISLYKGKNLCSKYLEKMQDFITTVKVLDPNLYSYISNFSDKVFLQLLSERDSNNIKSILSLANTVASQTLYSINTTMTTTMSSSIVYTFDITSIAVSCIIANGNQTDNSDYYKVGYAFNNIPYYGSKTTFTLDSANNLTIASDGDPYPAKAGKQSFTNNATTARQFGNITLNEQYYNYTFVYRGGTNTQAGNYQFYSVDSTKGMGTQGLFTNGVSLDNPSAGLSVTGADSIAANVHGGQKYAFNAVFFSSLYGIDNAGGHPSSTGYPDSNDNQSQYHLHDNLFFSTNGFNNPTFYESNSYYGSTNYNGDYLRNSDGHSKIIAILFDGYPVYGPYGYTNALDSGSTIIRMTSSYTTKSEPFSGRPYTYSDIAYTNAGTATVISAGAYLNDFEYIDGLGTLDIHNGRYCVTPEYPNGTYAYFATVDENLEPVFPYFVGEYSKQTINFTNNGYNGK